MENPSGVIDITEKRIKLEKIKSLEDGIISYINNSEYNYNKSIFLSMLINYIMPYNDHDTSIKELTLNNGIGFEKYIKQYLIELLTYYKEPKSSLTNTNISLIDLKLMLLSFFNTKISIILPNINEIYNIKTGAVRSRPLKSGISPDIKLTPSASPSGATPIVKSPITKSPSTPPSETPIAIPSASPSETPIAIPSASPSETPSTPPRAHPIETPSAPPSETSGIDSSKIPIDNTADIQKEFEKEKEINFKSLSYFSESINNLILLLSKVPITYQAVPTPPPPIPQPQPQLPPRRRSKRQSISL
jgi:hypothetical protein